MVKKRVTQADVARKAGVSQTAVSQILSRRTDVVTNFRPSTRQKVIRAAEELGYVPSMMARALRTNRTMTIGLVLGFITDELSLRITHGIQEVAHERGYGVLIGDTEQNPDLEVRLIFVDSWTDPATYLHDESVAPMVFAQLRQMMQKQNCVGVNNFRGGYEATRHLLDLGYRKVAHISGPENWWSAAERFRGYQQALEDYGFQYNPSLIEFGDWEISSGADTTDLLLDRHPDIDAIFVANDLMAAGSIQAAMRRGMDIPQELALVGFDDRQVAEALFPPLTSFALPLNLMGQKAAHLLIDRLLKNNARYVPSINVAGSLVVRESCGALVSS